MGIVLKRKAPEVAAEVAAGVVAGAVAAVKKVIKLGGAKPGNPVVEQNQEDADALALVGLSSAPSVPYQTAGDKAKALKGQWPALSEGEKVVITNDLYTWVDRWLPGDTGVVVRYFPPVQEARMEGNKWGLVIVKLDRPRKAGHEVCYFHNWELRRVSE